MPTRRDRRRAAELRHQAQNLRRSLTSAKTERDFFLRALTQSKVSAAVHLATRMDKLDILEQAADELESRPTQ